MNKIPSSKEQRLFCDFQNLLPRLNKQQVYYNNQFQVEKAHSYSTYSFTAEVVIVLYIAFKFANSTRAILWYQRATPSLLSFDLSRSARVP